jgi:DnaB-like helicase N terminal domain/AAA domain
VEEAPGAARPRKRTKGQRAAGPVTSARANVKTPLTIDRSLPHNSETERAVLGAILLDNRSLNTVLERLRPEDFFLDPHRRVYQQMIVLGESQRAIDLVTLTEELHRRGELEAAGGAPYLAALVDGVPKVSNVEHYARIVKEKALLRNLIHATHAIQERAFAASEDAATVVSDAVRTLGGLAPETKRSLLSYSAEELVSLAPSSAEVIAYPIASRGQVSVLDGAAKLAGKTTLILHGVRAELHEEPFLGEATRRAPVLLVTEENQRTIALAVKRCGLEGEKDLHVVPWASVGGVDWFALAERLQEKCGALGIGWLVVDTFFAVAGLGSDQENSAGSVDKAIAPLRCMAGKLDIAITLTRHTRKAGGSIGTSGRGSTALTGAADNVLELKRVSGSQGNVRQLEITGRVEQRRIRIELRDGSYICHGEHAPSAIPSSERAEGLGRAIAAQPTASSRHLARQLGISRNRVVAIAEKIGWARDANGWKRVNP